MELDLVMIKFDDNEINRRDTPKIRGYIASKFPEYIELHHHIDSGFLYRYPVIQYKTINRCPIFIGIGRGAEILIKIEPMIKQLDISGQVSEVYQKSICYKKEPFGLADKLIQYKFVTPWMALNQANYNLYIQKDRSEKINLLKRILTGNILSMSKGLNYNVEGTIQCMIQVNSLDINFKGRKMIAFKGSFISNFYIPDFLGIGKSVSRGYGTVIMEQAGFV